MSESVGKMSQTPGRQRRHYVPFHEAVPGMVLGENMTLTDRHVVRFSLPAGTELTEGHLRQMAIHHAEFVCIAEPDTRSDETIALDTAAAAARVLHIFDGADLSQPALAALFDRILAYRNR